MNEPTPEASTAPPRDTPSAAPCAASAAPLDLWERVKQHKVLQWGIAYLGAALAFAHGGDLLGHAFHWPEAVNRLLLGILIVGFPIALALAWYHGHRSLRTVSTAEASIISILLVIGAGLLVLFVRPSAEEVPAVSPPLTAIAATPPIGPAPVAADSGPSIAVLPFVNMSSDHEQDYFSDGLSEELLNELTQIPSLRVIGRTSSFAFKGKNEDLRSIGETLGVDHILEGSVRKSGGNLRITAQLINPADGSHLWAATYDRKVGDIFAIQEDIARTVAASLRLSIEVTNIGEGGTHNLEAYDAFLRASSMASPGDAVPYLERAVDLDPQFTQAWTGLSGAAGAAAIFDPEHSAEWLQKRREATSKVLALAPQSSAAKMILAANEAEAGHLLAAEQLLQSVRNLTNGGTAEANLTYGIFLLGVGRPHDALELLRTVVQADPISVPAQTLLQINYETLGEMKEAEDAYRHTLTIIPNNEIMQSASVLRAMGMRDSIALRTAILQRQGLPPALGTADPTDINVAMAALLDNAPAALTQLRRWSVDPNIPRQPLTLIVQANWAAYFGDAALSLNLLRRVPLKASNALSSLLFSLWRPVERPIRTLPQFKDFVRDLGLVDYWRLSGKWGDFCHSVGENDFECR